MCTILKVNRSTYYYESSQPLSTDDEMEQQSSVFFTRISAFTEPKKSRQPYKKMDGSFPDGVLGVSWRRTVLFRRIRLPSINRITLLQKMNHSRRLWVIWRMSELQTNGTTSACSWTYSIGRLLGIAVEPVKMPRSLRIAFYILIWTFPYQFLKLPFHELKWPEVFGLPHLMVLGAAWISTISH